jgi:hypothetical protein
LNFEKEIPEMPDNDNKHSQAIDINDPSLVTEELNVDTEKDQFASMPVIDDGTYRAKLIQRKPSESESFWIRSTTKKAGKPYLATGIEARIVDPGGKFDDWPLFDNFVSTLVMEMTGTNKIVGILKAGGVTLPVRITDVELARALDAFLQSEPTLGIVTQVEGYCDGCEKTKLKGQRKVNPKGSTACPTCGNPLALQARIIKYIPEASVAAHVGA